MQWLVMELTWRQPFPFTSNFVWKTGITVTKNTYLTLFLVRMSRITLKEDNYLSRFMAAVGRYCYTQWHTVPSIALYVFLNQNLWTEPHRPKQDAERSLPCFSQSHSWQAVTALFFQYYLGGIVCIRERSNLYLSINCLPRGLHEPEEEQKTDSTQIRRPSQWGNSPYRSSWGNSW